MYSSPLPIAVNLSFQNELYLFDNKGHDYFFPHSFGERG
jgi:hypothetical protein